MSISAGIDDAVAANPGILDTPGLAMDAASSSDPLTASPALSHASNALATGQAISDAQTSADPQANQSASGGGGFFGFLSKAAHFVGHSFQALPGVHGVEHAVGTAVKYLSKPLQELQKDYRFIHTVYAKEGLVSGFLATGGLLAGAAVGSLVDEPLLGAGLAAELERGVAGVGGFGQNMRAAAELASSNQQKISFGRDLANALGDIPGLHTFHNTDQGLGKVLSGGADAGADFFADPIVLASKLRTGLKVGDLGKLARQVSGGVVPQDATVLRKIRGLVNGDLGVSAQMDAVRGAFDRLAPGTTLRNAEQVATLYGPGENGSGLAGVAYRRFLDHVVEINKTSKTPSADIARLYPEVANLAFKTIKDDSGNVIAKGYGSATTRAEAQQVALDVATKGDMNARLTNAAVLPTRTLARAGVQHTAEWLRNISPDTTRAEQPSLTGGALTAARQLVTLHPGDAASTIGAAAAGKIRTFTGMMPFAMNAKTAALSTTEMQWHEGIGLDPNGIAAARNAFKFGLGTTVGNYYVDQLINAHTFGEARRIWHEANLENLKAMGIPGDQAEEMWALRNSSLDAMSPVVGAPGDKYGHGYELGADVDLQPSGDAQVPAALWSHQASNTLAFPNFKDALLAQRQAQGAFKANYGKFDDIAYRHYMGPVFKTSALLNTGFALRVAAAEVIPQLMRVGVWQHIKDYAATQAATKGYAMGDKEKEAVAATVLHALSQHPIKGTAQILGRPLRAANTGMWRGVHAMLNDKDAAEFATRLVVAGDGHIASGVASTSEHSGGDSVGSDPQVRAQIGAHLTQDVHGNDRRIGYRDSGQYYTVGPYDKQYDGFLHLNWSKAAANPAQRNIARDLGSADTHRIAVDNEAQRIKAALNGAPDADPAYVKEIKLLQGHTNIKANNWTPEDYAYRRVDDMRGMLYGADGTYHANVAAQIARGEKPSLEQVSDIPFESRPAQAIGGERVPFIGPNVVQKVANWGYARVIDKIINHISRDPIYFNSTYHEYGLLKQFVDRGEMDDETAFRLARTRGAVSMVPKIHNTALRSQFAVLANNFMPFYFAQEQALKRAGRLVINNPNALRQYQLVNQGLNNPGFVKTDASGNKYLIFPGSGVLGNVVPSLLENSLMFGDKMQAGLPLSVQGSLASLNTLMPEANQPGVSPLVSVPLNKLAQIFPELSPEVKTVVGARGFNQPALAALVPSPITRNLQNFISPDETSSAFVNSWLTAYASAVYHGQAPGPNAPANVRDAFIARLKNNTRSTFLVKMLLGFVSPLAPSVRVEDAGFRDEFTHLVKTLPGGYAAALQQFEKEHGSSAVSYTVAQSKSNIPDFHNPYTAAAMQYFNDNQALIHSQFAAGGAWLAPQAQGPGDIQTIHSELVRQHLRSTDTPQAFADQIAIAQGEATVNKALTAHIDYQAAHKGDSVALSNEASNWSNYVATAKYNNPIWGDWYTSPQRTSDAVKAYEDLVVLFLHGGTTTTINGKRVVVPSLPQGPQTDAVANLLSAFAQHRAEMAANPSNTRGDSQARTDEKAKFAAYLDQQEKNPILYPIVHGVFRRLDAGLGNP